MLGVREPGARLDVHVRRRPRARRRVSDRVREGVFRDDGQHPRLGVELPEPGGVNLVPHLEGDAEHHRRALFELGRAGYRAAHRLDDVVCDGQAQTGTAVLASRRDGGLAEGHEYELELISSDADAVVANLERDDDPRRVRRQEIVLHHLLVGAVVRALVVLLLVLVQGEPHRPRFTAADAPRDVVVARPRDATRDRVVIREDGDAQAHLAALSRELDAVVDDVDERLAKPELVAPHVETVELGRDVEDELDLVLVRLVADDVYELVDHLVDVERLDHELLMHPAGTLQLGKIQNLTDDTEESLRGDDGG